MIAGGVGDGHQSRLSSRRDRGRARRSVSEPLLLQALVRIGHRDTRIFVTVPRGRWAIAERQRLGIPIDRTRFRTAAGDEVFSRSVTLDAPELRDLFEQSGLRGVESGTIVAEDWIGGPQPEIAWAVGGPTLAVCP